jgi:hypothetical protein
MSWDKIKKFLLDNVIDSMNDPTRGRKWLNALEKKSCPDGKRLGACIAIDVKSGALTGQTFADILDTMDTSPAALKDACRAFGITLAKHPKQAAFICASQYSGDPLPKTNHYVRVLSLDAFIEFYVQPTYAAIGFDQVSLDDVRTMFFDEPVHSNLGEIEAWWSGRNGNVWVLSYEDLDKLVGQSTGAERASLLNDALGMGIDGKDLHWPELVAVYYPSDLDVECRQPTTLDASWDMPGSYYVSYGNFDRWGRTHSCSGERERIRERVHLKFKNLTRDYSIYQLGIVSDLKVDRNKLLDEAFTRFDEC